MRRLLILVLLAGCVGSPPDDTMDDDDAVDDDDAMDDDDAVDDDDAAPAPCADGSVPTPGADVTLQVVASGLSRPVWIGNAGDGSARLFAAEQTGVLHDVTEGGPAPYLDVADTIDINGYDERGLLGVAFHPRFADDGRVFVHYVSSGGTRGVSRVSEFTVAGDPSLEPPDPFSERILLELDQPAFNHNGGDLAFSPVDGMLYISFGDGGGSGDTHGNGQNPGSLHSKILRIDVDAGDPYGIPEDNPFVRDANHRPETWAWGFRNPWRMAFDRLDGALWIGDVGQFRWEEIDLGVAGANYGWPEVEGSHCFRDGCDPSLFEAPVHEYGHDVGESVTGGRVYRGCTLPDLDGVYLFSDYQGDSPLWSLVRTGDAVTDGPVSLSDTGARISAFGEDEQGEVYVADHPSGRVLRIVPR